MALPRRRYNYYHRLRSLLPVLSAISGALLIFFAILSILAPSPNESDQFHLRHHQTSFNAVVEASDEDSGFRIPVRNSGGKLDRDIWSSRNAKFFYGCSNASSKFARAEVITHPSRYLAIATSGGLNQQRTGITDAVVAARILNATLVVPKLDQKSFWKDASNFSEIFDVDWFISFLSKDVKIIKQLPKRGGKNWTPYTMRVPRKCSERCYRNRVLPVLLKRHNAVQLNKFDYRLANKLDTDLQKLRCRVNYHALKFTNSIQEMGEKLVQRMRMRSKHYIALHLRHGRPSTKFVMIDTYIYFNESMNHYFQAIAFLFNNRGKYKIIDAAKHFCYRFEPDMLAFSGCDYGGGEKERTELGAIRKRWKTLHKNNPDKQRRQGKCPLTPEEVGLMLRALGYGSDVHIYVASGEVYGGEETLRPLKALFPNFYSKETIATKEELEPFTSYSSRMAALDFIVCDESDVFVTNNNGNMARIIAGRRKYFGHKPTIRPNAKKLYRLFPSRSNMTWEAFASRVRTLQRGFMGEPNEVRPGRGEFHENPSTCICEDSAAKEKAKADSKHKKHAKVEDSSKKDVASDEQTDEDDDEPEWPDMEDDEDQSGLQEKGVYNITGSDYDAVNSDEPELEEMLSD
ncbi:GDP-fucose protein O-fucosyltransferase [Corchorus olitorius]|uniref:O-fucosyltransferase family protein n=1 Tax=Corchorus olitorius TaxID=93759 RepID=A0A1R3KVS3_9ROSI|nr:GDP-fucose protein O-fucosyltransferase [Corchorus olitorius]